MKGDKKENKKGKRKHKKKGQKEIDVDAELGSLYQMDIEQVQRYAKAVHEAILAERAARDLWRTEASKLLAYWQIHRASLEKYKAQLRDLKNAQEDLAVEGGTKVTRANNKVAAEMLELGRTRKEALHRKAYRRAETARCHSQKERQLVSDRWGERARAAEAERDLAQNLASARTEHQRLVTAAVVERLAGLAALDMRTTRRRLRDEAVMDEHDLKTRAIEAVKDAELRSAEERAERDLNDACDVFLIAVAHNARDVVTLRDRFCRLVFLAEAGQRQIDTEREETKRLRKSLYDSRQHMYGLLYDTRHGSELKRRLKAVKAYLDESEDRLENAKLRTEQALMEKDRTGKASEFIRERYTKTVMKTFTNTCKRFLVMERIEADLKKVLHVYALALGATPREMGAAVTEGSAARTDLPGCWREAGVAHREHVTLRTLFRRAASDTGVRLEDLGFRIVSDRWPLPREMFQLNLA